MNPRRFRSNSAGLPHRAFTLVEVMLALVIVLVLMVGMNVVFSTTSKAVQAGQALNEATRNARAVQPLFFEDFKNCAADSPAFIITSGAVTQYLNSDDAKVGATLPKFGCVTNDYVHRCDTVSFFARGLYKRKTSNSPDLSSSTVGNEAFIQLGHLRMLSSDAVTYAAPDDLNIVNLPYASEWLLGRHIELLKPAQANTGGALVVNNATDRSNNNENFYPPVGSANGPVTTSVPSATYVYPLRYGTASTALNAGDAANTIQSARYDMAGVSIDQYRSIVTDATYVQSTGTPSTNANLWWTYLVYSAPFATVASNASVPCYPYYPTPNYSAVKYRYNASTVLGVKPFSSGTGSSDVAGLSPVMLEHVSQFIVEYAGDFVTQDITTGNTSSNVTDTIPDGQIDWTYTTKGKWLAATTYQPGDYVFESSGGVLTYYRNNSAGNKGNDPSSNSSGPTPVWTKADLTGASGPVPPKQIRWYGMPRDAVGSGAVPGFDTSTNKTANLLYNVVPLYDVWQTSLNNSSRPLPYEVETGPTLGASGNDYADASTGMALNNGAGTIKTARYTAIWQNDVPAMVRILMKVDDPTDALPSGPWFEYVFKLK